ncbi:MAG: amino acid racemase [Ottowia sp.]|uniref:aspartate/glutamate racemase family protein n=1 Tax=Ottowia sp. TaxID=1898956 RepID=UPI0039E562D0
MTLCASLAAPLHVGIVGCSAEGAALCYRTLCAEGAARLGEHRHPPVSMHTPSLQDYVQCLERGDLDGVAALMLDSARRLQAAGAEFLICPDNTVHAAFDRVREASPLPWLHIAEVVAEEALRRGLRRVGLTGTAWLVASDVYPAALAARGIDCVRPTEAQRLEMGRRIMDELVPGRIEFATVRYFQSVVEHFRDVGCDAVILGCTEIPLVLSDANAALPTLDSTRLLARAALDRALAGMSC